LGVAYRPHHFSRVSRAEYYALTGSLDPTLRYELLDGIIYAADPRSPAHAGVITSLYQRLRTLDTSLQIAMLSVLEIDPDGAPQPDITIVSFRHDDNPKVHPNGADALLVIEVGDVERNPPQKMRAYMRDGRIPQAWRIDIARRCVEIWKPSSIDEPVTRLRGRDIFGFESASFIVDDMFASFDDMFAILGEIANAQSCPQLQ
jgi:Uma2 family endonuclease